MTVDVQLFAGLRDTVGKGNVLLEVADSATVADLLVAIEQQLPTATNLVRLSRIAVDQRFAALDTPLADCREVALIPPVSGG